MNTGAEAKCDRMQETNDQGTIGDLTAKMEEAAGKKDYVSAGFFQNKILSLQREQKLSSCVVCTTDFDDRWFVHCEVCEDREKRGTKIRDKVCQYCQCGYERYHCCQNTYPNQHEELHWDNLSASISASEFIQGIQASDNSRGNELDASESNCFNIEMARLCCAEKEERGTDANTIACRLPLGGSD